MYYDSNSAPDHCLAHKVWSLPDMWPVMTPQQQPCAWRVLGHSELNTVIKTSLWWHHLWRHTVSGIQTRTKSRNSLTKKLFSGNRAIFFVASWYHHWGLLRHISPVVRKNRAGPKSVKTEIYFDMFCLALANQYQKHILILLQLKRW